MSNILGKGGGGGGKKGPSIGDLQGMALDLSDMNWQALGSMTYVSGDINQGATLAEQTAAVKAIARAQVEEIAATKAREIALKSEEDEDWITWRTFKRQEFGIWVHFDEVGFREGWREGRKQDRDIARYYALIREGFGHWYTKVPWK